jgi:hypothetical protein
VGIKRVCVCIIPISILLAGVLSADSPITSTYFADVYSDLPMVKKAIDSDGILTKEMSGFLSSDKNPIDAKAAVINGLGWDFNGKQNAEYYFKYLLQRYPAGIDSNTLEPLSADEIFCFGYLRAMDDYFNVIDALDILYLAWEMNDSSFTVSLIYAIVEAQDAMDYDWCEVWMLVEDVLMDESLKRDMREGAVNSILEYMRLYEEYCDEYDENPYEDHE